MKTTSFFLFVYSIIVFLSGSMAYFHAESMQGLYFEMIGGSIIFICAILMIKNKNFSQYISIVFSILLLIYYSYRFSVTTNYIFGVLTGASVFMVIILLIKIFHINTE